MIKADLIILVVMIAICMILKVWGERNPAKDKMGHYPGWVTFLSVLFCFLCVSLFICILLTIIMF